MHLVCLIDGQSCSTQGSTCNEDEILFTQCQLASYWSMPCAKVEFAALTLPPGMQRSRIGVKLSVCCQQQLLRTLG